MRSLSILILIALAVPAWASSDQPRVFEFTYEMLAGDLPSSEVVDIYIPRPREGAGQRILDTRISATLPLEQGWETRYNNGYYHLRRPANVNAPIELSLTWTISRDVALPETIEELSSAQTKQFLNSNLLVPVNHPMLNPILAEIHAARVDDSKAATARAIYDWIVDNIEYKKVGTGWGNGDTFWACSERYGNCTDFHALFISLARSEGIPARFEIGFPVPQDRSSGEIAGYHCWVQFYLPEQGWIPIDASEAAKHPEKREQYYGSYPADRIHFTTGRDLALTEVGKQVPLNYFIYPYVEVGGKPWSSKLNTRFHYKEID